MKRLVFASLLLTQVAALAVEPARFEFKLLGTSKTSTMEKEMNDAAQAGYVYQSVMGGETAFGGKEVIVIMGRNAAGSGQKSYRLLAANKTSTLEKEMQLAADTGYEYKGQTVFESAFGGREVAVIMERDSKASGKTSVYRLLATSKTSTMERELAGLGAEGFAVVGMTVSKTAFGGNEVVCILKRVAE
ncbi:MAG TPA: hypothetical protein VER03_20060 [Bryobacteraceae bacterium]|nr:hypothetical protein [Bryobacteraceae bacterium]